MTTINYKFKNMGSDNALQQLFEQKFTSIEVYLGNETDQKMDIEFERLVAHQNGDTCRLEATVWNGGKLYRSETVKESFEKAIDEVRDELDKEFRRANRKRENMFRKGSRVIKDMMRLGK